jgi:hypothetical protein
LLVQANDALIRAEVEQFGKVPFLAGLGGIPA